MTTTVVRGAWRTLTVSEDDRAFARRFRGTTYGRNLADDVTMSCATGRTAGARGVAPIVTGVAPSKRGIKITNARLRWPVKAVARCGIMVQGVESDAVAITVLAVDECARLRRASRRAARLAERLERDHTTMHRTATHLLAVEGAARLAGDETYAEWLTDARSAIGSLDRAEATRTEARRCATILSDAYALWRQWVIRAENGDPAEPSDAAYVLADDWHGDDAPVSVHLRALRQELNHESDAILRKITAEG
jgi:hypothetical protein